MANGINQSFYVFDKKKDSICMVAGRDQEGQHIFICGLFFF